MTDETPDVGVEQSTAPAYRQPMNIPSSPMYGPYGPYSNDDLSMVKLWYQSKAIITSVISSLCGFAFAMLKYLHILTVPPEITEPLKILFVSVVGVLIAIFLRKGDKRIVSKQQYNDIAQRAANRAAFNNPSGPMANGPG